MALGLLMGTGEASNPAQAGEKPSKAVTHDPVQEEVETLISEIRTHLGYVGEVRPATGEEIEGHINDMGDEDYSKREKASKALTEIGYQAKPALKHALNNPDVEIVKRAERILKASKSAFAVVDEERADKLKIPVNRLGQIGATAKDAVPVLIEVLAENNTDIKQKAAESLGSIGPVAKEAVPALIVALEHSEDAVAKAAADALGNIGPGAKEAVPVLVKVINDKLGRVITRGSGFDTQVQAVRAAAAALASMGTEAKEAVPALLAIFKDSTRPFWIKGAVLKTLVHIEPEAKTIVPVLIDALKDDEAPVRCAAAIALRRLGVEAKEAVPALITGLKDSNVWVVKEVVHALVCMGAEAKDAVAALKTLRDSKPSDDEVSLWGLAIANEVRREAKAAIEAIEQTRIR